MTMLESPAYADLDVVEAELIDVVDDADVRHATDLVDLIARDAEPALDAMVVDALAIDVDVIEAEAVDVDPDDADADGRALPAGEPQPGRHLRIAPDLVGRRRRVRIAAAGAAVAISATLFAVVGFNVELAQHQIQLQKLQEQLQGEQRHYSDLRKEVAERSAPQTIVGEAQAEGLVPATNSDLPVPIPPPPDDRSGELNLLGNVHDNAGDSLAPVQ